jgi:hypothetical protein
MVSLTYNLYHYSIANLIGSDMPHFTQFDRQRSLLEKRVSFVRRKRPEVGELAF